MAQDLSVNAIYTYIQGFIEVDQDDIAPDLCNQWVYAGFDDLVGQAVDWPFYQVGDLTNPYQLTTVIGQQNYQLPLASVANGTATVQATVNARRLVAIQGPHWELQYLGQTELESTYTPNFIPSQEPEHYSLWGPTGVTLWPIPNGVFTLNLRAYREPIDWVALGAAGAIDAPPDFFTALQTYVLSMGFAQQTDLGQSSYWMQQYQAQKLRLRQKWIQTPMPENFVLNGGAVSRELPPRLRYPFEGSNQI